MLSYAIFRRGNCKLKRRLQNMMIKVQQFMYGRYGYDPLSKFMCIMSVIIIAVYLIFWSHISLYLLSTILLLLVVLRSLSRDFDKRRKELNLYLRCSEKIRSWFKLTKKRWDERKTHVYFKCKKCKAMLRVPKGKGEIKVTCPKCKSEIDKKT